MSIRKIAFASILTMLVASPVPYVMPVAQADDAGAFFGGVMAARIGRSIRDNARYQEEQAYYARQQAQEAQQARQMQQMQQMQQAPPPPAQKSARQKLEELDSLAAGGYISPDEYKMKKQQILNNM